MARHHTRMDYRQLGRSGLRVSALTLGTMTFGGRGHVRERRRRPTSPARGARSTAASTPGSTSSTRPTSTPTACPRRSSARRCRAAATASLLATKARMPMGDGPNDAGLSRQHLDRSVRGEPAAAADRPHRPLPGARVGRPDAARGDARRARHLVRSGKVRYVGCSNYAAWQLMKALGIAERRGLQRFVTQQIHYSLQAREAEYELVPVARRPGRRHPRLEPAGRRPADAASYRRDRRRAAGLAPAQRLGRAAGPRRGGALRRSSRSSSRSAEAHGVSPAQVALAWLLGRPGVYLGDRRRAHRRAARRQSRGRRARAHRRGARPARRGQRARRCSIPTGTRLKTASDRLGPADLTLLGPHLEAGA